MKPTHTPPTAAEYFQNHPYVTVHDALYLYETLLNRKEEGQNVPQSLLDDLYHLVQTVEPLNYY